MINEVIAELFAGRAVIKEPELCKALGICRRKALTLRHQHKLGYYEDGRTITYGPDHILAYLNRQNVPAK